jgi:hypothetical protein
VLVHRRTPNQPTFKEIDVASKDDTTSTDSHRNQTDEHVSAETPSSPSTRPRSLHQAIEAERSQLLQAHAVVHCLYEVLLHAEGDDAICYAEAAYVAANLIDESVGRLDSVRLRPLIDELTGTHVRRNEVRETRGLYLVEMSS